MNSIVLMCLVIAVPFGILGIIFTLLKEKAAMLISGFNTLPMEEREQYDKKRISTDMRNSFFLWSLVMFLGAGLSYLISYYFGIFSFVVWLILLIKNVHLDEDKAFAKYKKGE